MNSIENQYQSLDSFKAFSHKLREFPETGNPRTCTLTATEFIRRFLQHVLPKGFVKVRYYGFFAPGLRSRLTAVCQQLSVPPPAPAACSESKTLKPDRSLLCPRCGLPMTHRQRIWPRSRWPPVACFVAWIVWPVDCRYFALPAHRLLASKPACFH